MKQTFRHLLRRVTGYDLVRHRERDALEEMFPDFSGAEHAILRRVQPYTMTSVHRLAAVLSAVRHVVEHKVPGDYVECGVWRGGSSMAAALMFLELGDTSRQLHLFDTYEGMSAPSEHDRDLTGTSAAALLQRDAPQTGIWCYASLEDVRANLLSTGYAADRLHFHAGKVEQTIPGAGPATISLLRLDTDWYESTRHELEHLYPRLAPDGPLIIDDYGHWQGARRAVDEFFAAMGRPANLHRIDYTGRLHFKPRA